MFRVVVYTILIITLVVAAFIGVVGFAYYNISQTVDVHLQPIYNDYVDVPLVTVVFISFSVGLVLALMIFSTLYIRQAVSARSVRKNLRALEQEVAILRNRPIEESADLLAGADSQRDKTYSAFKDI